MTKPGTDREVADEAPWSEGITEYDEAHFVMYLRLLDANAEGVSADEMARVVLAIDPVHEPDRARKAVASHLRRAQWMTEKGYYRLMGH